MFKTTFNNISVLNMAVFFVMDRNWIHNFNGYRHW